MSYVRTFIQVAEDSVATTGEVPKEMRGRKTVPGLQYELLSAAPYGMTYDDLLYEIHLRRNEIPEAEQETRGGEIRAELLAKEHPCLRTSSLPKRYGWGVHYDDEGRIALYAVDSDEYERLSTPAPDGPTLLTAFRSRR